MASNAVRQQASRQIMKDRLTGRSTLRASRATLLLISSMAGMAVTAPGIVGLAGAQPQVKVVANEPARRVDITVDGQPFTSYIWPTTLKKPVLYPLQTAAGVV